MEGNPGYRGDELLIQEAVQQMMAKLVPETIYIRLKAQLITPFLRF